MKVTVDDSICTGCEVCSDLVPEVFELSDDMVSVVKTPSGVVPSDKEALVRESAENCPVCCIEIDE